MTRIALLILVLIALLASAVVNAATTTNYDFSVRSPGGNIFAYDGTSTTQVPNNNTSPSVQHTSGEYTAIATNDGNGNVISTTKNKDYPSIRYVIEIDEEIRNVSGLSFFWNGWGYNNSSSRGDGVKIYIWNFASNSYQLARSTTTRNEVSLTFSITSSLSNYIDASSNKVIIYIVTPQKTAGPKTNAIITDYLQLTVTAEVVSPANLLANFQFDECAYRGTGNEVIDQLGRYSGTSHNSVNTSVNGQIEKALAINNAQQHVQTNIPLPSSYSVATWFKKPTDTSGNPFFILGAMESGGDLLVLDRNNGWRWGIYDVSSGSPRTINGNYSFSSLDDNWHHMTLVYHANQTSLYIDGRYIESINLTPSGSLKYIGTSFDDIASANPQGFRAPLDEFMVFDGVLTAAEIGDIYTQQNNGNNFDGTTRLANACAAILANFQFDECAYYGTGNEVLDQLGNYSGSSQNGVNTSVDGQIEKALAITNAQQHVQISIPLPSSYSVATWFKKPTDTSGSPYFILGAMKNGGDLLFLDRNNGWRWGIYDADSSTSINGSYSFSGLDNNWHHMTLLYQNNQSQLYIDGVFIESINLMPSGTLTYLGTSFDDISSANPQGFRAPLDEFIVFSGVLTLREISQIYAQQGRGSNYDGSTRTIKSCAVVRANFKFDELAYGDIPGEVTDSVGTFHGRAKSAQTVAGKVCRAVDLSAPGTGNYVVLDESALDNKSEFSISLWAKTAKTGTQSFVSGANAGSHNELIMWFTSHTQFRPHVQNRQNGTLTVSSIAGDAWRHLVWTQGNDESCLFIDSVAQGCLNQTTSVLEIQSLILGQEQDSVGGSFDDSQAFDGLLDELVIFDGVLNAGKIAQIYNFQNNGLGLNGETIACPEPAIHHYEIVHDGNGLTCAVEPITIKACANSDCTNLSAESMSLEFTITSPSEGTVTEVIPTFTGSTRIDFSHTTAEAVRLSIDGATIAASNAVECTGFGSSCVMTFADAGFRFLYGDNNSEVIGHQTAGKGFSETLKLQAVKNNNGVCEGIFSGAVNVSLAQQNVTPALAFNAGLAFQASGVNIAKYPLFSDNVSLNFGNDSIAVLPNSNYLDAGEIRLHARYANADIAIVGSTNDFWVKPDRFEILAKNSTGILNGNSAVSTIRHKASENFDFTVRALNFAGNLTQNYRQADGQLALKVSRIAPTKNGAIDGRFTYAAGQSRTTSTSAIFQPAILSNFSDDEKGSSTFNNAQYDEVGVINIDVQDINYGGLGNVEGLVSANDLTIGRFTPAYFKQTVKEEHKGKLDAYQSAVGTCAIADWAYTGQRTSDDKGAIGYSLEPKITISAFNANGGMTKNYTLGEAENFMKLSSASVNIELPRHDESQQIFDSVADNPVAITAVMALGSLSASSDDSGRLIAGEWLYTFSSNDHFSYKRDDTSFLAPFGAKIPFVTEQITDSDGITLQMDASTNKVVATAIEKFVTDGVEIRFARMVLENSYGSENSTLRAPLSVQVFDGTGFYTHTDESCLTALIGDKKSGTKYSGNMSLWQYRLIDIASDAIQVDDTEANISGVLDRGIQQQLFFSPPAKQGTLEWEYEVPSWLKFKWDALDGDNDGNFYDDNPSAMLSFGIYRGNDRIISWREVVN